METCNKYSLYIGLNDKDTLEQMMPTKKFIKIISKICKSQNIGFSIKSMNGGYIHNSGIYTFENSIELSIFGVTEEQIMTLAKKLKKIFNQESIIVIKEKVETTFI